MARLSDRERRTTDSGVRRGSHGRGCRRSRRCDERCSRERPPSGRHLRGEIYEVRADGDRHAFRLLFAQETKFILLSLSGFAKKSRKTPPEEIVRAEARLKDWRSRGRS